MTRLKLSWIMDKISRFWLENWLKKFTTKTLTIFYLNFQTRNPQTLSKSKPTKTSNPHKSNVREPSVLSLTAAKKIESVSFLQAAAQKTPSQVVVVAPPLSSEKFWFLFSADTTLEQHFSQLFQDFYTQYLTTAAYCKKQNKNCQLGVVAALSIC